MATRIEGKVIGLIGDEHLVGPFGRRVVAALRTANALVVEDGRVGRKAADLLLPQPEAPKQTSGLGRSGPDVIPTVLGTQPHTIILVLKPCDELDRVKALLHSRGVKEVWVATPTGTLPDQEAAHVIGKLLGTPPPSTQPVQPVTIRPVRNRV